MSYAIRINNVSKKYNIIKSGERFSTLRDRFTDAIIFSQKRQKKLEEFWALKDINFNVNHGEVVGVIGSNGAGKSTLLKILSKITLPTTGKVEFNGRTASLLEVGTGFHPELSGRENIFLNGAILGMKYEEINRKFAEIVEFSGVKKFLDMPVKKYSSGMSVRLAFSIAANLNHEILLLDEVLSVGDVEFQKKSLAKIKEATQKTKRTILLVSHNMQTIKNLCNRCIYLKDGGIEYLGDTERAINKYLQSMDSITMDSAIETQKIIDQLPIDPVFKLKSIELKQQNEQIFQCVVSGLPIEVKIQYKVYKKTAGLRVYFYLYDNDNNLIFRSFHDEREGEIPTMEAGEYCSSAFIPPNLLGPIEYKLCINAGIYNTRNLLPVGGLCVPLKVVRSSDYNRAYSDDSFYGKLDPTINWQTKKI